MLKLLNFYDVRDLEISKAFGQYVWDSYGNKYLDMHTGHGVAFLGHNNPHIVNALIDQMRKVIITSTSFISRVRDEMLDALSHVIPSYLTYTYLLNSGSEAVELALKLSRRVTKRKVFVALKGSFHGRTFGALSVTWNLRYRKPFEPLISDVRFLGPGDDIDKVIKEDVAAVIVEVIQGEGGVNVVDPKFLKSIWKRSLEVNALFIVDEVQTGFGRTGRVWAHEYVGIKPDIMTAGKALGGGFPVSAVFTNDFVASKISKGDHGSTYGGNPLACTAVKASTEVLINDSVHDKALVKGKELMGKLRKLLDGLEVVRDLRGLGLMIGIDLRTTPQEVIRCIQAKGVIVLKAGVTVIRLLPPYLINGEDIEWSSNAISECVKELNKRFISKALKKL